MKITVHILAPFRCSFNHLVAGLTHHTHSNAMKPLLIVSSILMGCLIEVNGSPSMYSTLPKIEDVFPSLYRNTRVLKVGWQNLLTRSSRYFVDFDLSLKWGSRYEINYEYFNKRFLNFFIAFSYCKICTVLRSRSRFTRNPYSISIFFCFATCFARLCLQYFLP